ncbi:LacI family transcriptional regulator [Asanoa ferruginea]|uniref:LacI family transcriptional regulator n=1 Tax=Asanoa ferruginea TaxID=53367 RepID=A0A3D9ZM47_9ACTN|nr:LacI family DNA-binding transcriptional regulator [Asanoa ferruginea]REF94720.1 LacI family transcriptional regulator [Asanoa ferruginea]GIF45702.1 LacI family transcriptional regulator [Asanoa ferruginea]
MVEGRRHTLRDIAATLDLSVNTVSRALSGKDGIGARTRALVRAEAERVGYVPNTLARSLVLGSAMTFGLVITNPSNPFYAQLISGIELRARAHGYSLLLAVTDESEEIEARAAESLLRSSVSGAIVVPVQGKVDPWRRLGGVGVPTVLINRDLPDLGYPFVGTDNALGAYQATAHAIARGARSIVVLEEDLPITTIEDRIAGFRRAMAEADLPVPRGSVISVPTRRYEEAALPWQPEQAYRVARRLLRRPALPDAVVVGNDYFALGLYRALHEHGLKVPGDMMVIGFGDYPFSEFLSPSLTTVRLPAQEVGSTAVDLLLEQIESPDAEPRKQLIAPTLVTRESTGPAIPRSRIPLT